MSSSLRRAAARIVLAAVQALVAGSLHAANVAQTPADAKATAGSASLAAPPTASAVERELSVLGDIVRATLARDVLSLRVRGVESHALPGQGGVLLVRMQPARQRPPRGSFGGEDGGIAVLDSLPALVDDILDDLGLRQGQTRVRDDEVTRELRVEQAEIRSEQRELLRELRDLRRARRLADTDATHAAAIADGERKLAQTEADYERVRARIVERQVAVDQHVAASRMRHADAAADQELAGSPNGQRTSTHASLIGTLCDYGSTLRSLSDTAFVSVIVTGSVESAGTYVFRKADLAACSAKRIDRDVLASRQVR